METIDIIFKELEKCGYQVTTDTRKDVLGSMYFALRGESWNGNAFVQNAISNGACGAVTDDPTIVGKNIYLVKNVLETLQSIAKKYRELFSIPIIVIGGSNGKTTSKDLARDVLRKKFKVHATEGSLNNHLGVPLSILSIPLDTEIGVFEIGANHRSEHSELLEIIQPTHVAVTNNGLDHLEGFGSPEGIRNANKEIYDWAKMHSVEIFVNRDFPDLMEDSSDTTRVLYPHQNLKVLDVTPLSISWNDIGYKTNLVGKYNLDNITLALAIGQKFEIDVELGLKTICDYLPSSKRSQFMTKNDINFIVDCYNANPTSMKLSLDSFFLSPIKNKGFILGDMLELGTYSEAEHKKIVEYALEQAVDCIVFIGENFKKQLKNRIGSEKWHWFPNSNSARLWFIAQKFTGFTFLLKGSRGMKVEKILDDFSSIHFDSREVLPNSLFVAIKGNAQDGNAFTHDAVQKGAVAIIHDTDLTHTVPNITYMRVSDSRATLAQIAENFYGNPSSKLKLVGITGTSGKTTTATLLFRLFRKLGFNVALLSTVENKINDEIYPTNLTTPDPITISSFLSKALERGCTHAFMECSSQAIHQKRTLGLHFAGALFLNLTHDHLDYHKTLEMYADAKKELFDLLPETSFALGNKDDERCGHILSDTKARTYFFGIKNATDFTGKITKQSANGLALSVNNTAVETRLIGTFNAYNVLGVFAAARLLGIQEDKIVSSIRELDAPTGRLEFIKSPHGVYGVVDYAHKPDALQNTLLTVRELVVDGSKIITVIGCGGDRDKTKRSIMGKIACDLSDYTIFTSDNPRSEDPETILQDMVSDLPTTAKNYECLVDRAVAISTACHKALPGDIILAAGKGHEMYQILKTNTVHFSDMEELQKNFNTI